MVSVRPLGSAGGIWTAYKGKGQPSCCSGASTALERAAEARLREDRRQVVGLQGVEEVVDAVRAGRIRRGLRREDRHDDVAVQSLESLDLNRPEVQRYVAELLLDPGFDKFVGELGEYYDRLKKTLPAEDAGATGATPFGSSTGP